MHLKQRVAGMQILMWARRPRRLCRVLRIIEGLESQWLHSSRTAQSLSSGVRILMCSEQPEALTDGKKTIKGLGYPNKRDLTSDKVIHVDERVEALAPHNCPGDLDTSHPRGPASKGQGDIHVLPALEDDAEEQQGEWVGMKCTEGPRDICTPHVRPHSHSRCGASRGSPPRRGDRSVECPCIPSWEYPSSHSDRDGTRGPL